jgi:hypothetical protein
MTMADAMGYIAVFFLGLVAGAWIVCLFASGRSDNTSSARPRMTLTVQSIDPQSGKVVAEHVYSRSDN